MISSSPDIGLVVCCLRILGNIISGPEEQVAVNSFSHFNLQLYPAGCIKGERFSICALETCRA